MTAKIITVAQQKGGAGKTTLALHLATSLAKQGHKVICFDIDPQGSLSEWYKRRQEKYGETRPYPEVKSLSGWRLGSEISRLQDKCDFFIIDCPPGLEVESKVAIRSANVALVPVQPSPIDVWSTAAILEFMNKENIPFRLVLNRMRATNLTDQIRKDLKQMHAPIAKTTIGSRVGFALSVMHGLGISEAIPNSEAAAEMDALADEVLKLARSKSAAA